VILVLVDDDELNVGRERPLQATREGETGVPGSEDSDSHTGVWGCAEVKTAVAQNSA